MQGAGCFEDHPYLEALELASKAGDIEEVVIGLADKKLAEIAALLEGHAGGDEFRLEDLEAFFAPLREALPEEEQEIRKPRLRLVM